MFNSNRERRKNIIQELNLNLMEIVEDDKVFFQMLLHGCSKKRIFKESQRTGWRAKLSLPRSNSSRIPEGKFFSGGRPPPIRQQRVRIYQGHIPQHGSGQNYRGKKIFSGSARKFQKTDPCTALDLSRFLGKLNHATQPINPAPLFYRTRLPQFCPMEREAELLSKGNL